jgi:nucleotide-binding universal stress UspA family protein
MIGNQNPQVVTSNGRHALTRLLVATDGMPSGDRAVALATDLAVRHGGEIELCYALDRIAALADSCVGYDSNTTIEPFLESLDESATQFLRQALDRIRRAGVVATASILNGGPVASIVSAESSRPFDALVMGSQGKHGLQRFLMGSVADSVLRRSSIPVFVVKPSPDTPKVRFDRVLVAVDGSRARSAVVDFALDFAENENMKIVACNVAATGADVAMDLLETLCHRARARGILCETVALTGDPGNQILATALARDVDFIIVGTHGRRGLPRWFSGSVAECIVEYSHVPVVVVPGERFYSSSRSS